MRSFESLIDRICDEALRGAVQSRDTITELLSVDPASEKSAVMRRAAHDLALKITGGHARIGGCIGLDYAPCFMSCKFCSFGEKWGIVGDEVVLGRDRIVELARGYVAAGINHLTLRTTEHYDHDALLGHIRAIRRAVPGVYEICVNTGELTNEAALECYEAGASAAYHVLRLREGVDTPFDPAERISTIDAICASPLKWQTCVEPIGVEHTDEEIAERIAFALSRAPRSLGIKPRVNVPGTPFAGMPPLPDERLCHIVAVVRLASGSRVRHVSAHPGEALAAFCGGSGSNVERGATPHDTSFNEREWRGVTPEDNARILMGAGFDCEPSIDDPRFREGADWWLPMPEADGEAEA